MQKRSCRSTSAASEYIYGLGINLQDYMFIESENPSNVKFYSWLDERFDRSVTDTPENNENVQDYPFKSSPYESMHPWISEKRACSHTVIPDERSWLIFIPFDTCAFKLGDSLLTQVKGHNGGLAPDISDPDYFIDCYEVVRELVEDGLVMAGSNVTDGGLITAAARMCGRYGMEIDISGIMSSYQEESRARVLFGEIPGVLIQVSNEDYDYVDAQLLLQDIAYYPVGHITRRKGVRISARGKNGIADILASLLDQATEGED